MPRRQVAPQKMERDPIKRRQQVKNVLEVLRRCKTVPQVNATESHYSQLITGLEKKDRARASHIKNLAHVRRVELRNERYHNDTT